MAGDYTFGSQMGGNDDPTADSLGDLLTYGAKPDEETPGQPNSAPTVKSDASAPNAPAAHVESAAVTPAPAAPSQASQAPVYTAPDQAPLKAAQAAKIADSKVSNVGPKWWERTLGGLTAGAMAFGKMPGAVEAGQAVTNRGQNAAELQRQGRLRADDATIQAWEDGQKQTQQDFQNQNEAYRSRQEGVRTDQEAAAQKQTQTNSDRTFNRETANDKFNQGRETANDTWEQGFKTTTQGETARHNKADEQNSAASTRIAGMRERREAAKQNRDDKLTGPEVQQQKAATATNDKYRTQVDQLENGNPKGTTPEEVQGFKATYRKAAASPTNPDTDKPWANDQEKQEYLDDLKQQNAERKNSVMQSFASDMTTLGRPTPIVVYDKEGRSTTQQPQGAPPTGGQPQGPDRTQTTTNNATSTPPEGTIQKPTQQATVKAGTVKVGDPVEFNGKKGKVVGINPKTGKPQVDWGK